MVDKETRIRNFFEDEGILNQKIDREILAAINGKLSWETPADPTQLEVFVYLARLLATEQRYDEAEPVYELVAGILDQCVGRYHPDSLYILYELANVYFVLDKTVYAERLYKHVMQGAQRIQGNEPLVFRCVIGLAGLYLRTEQYSIAEPFCRLIFEIYKRFHDVTSAEFRLAALNMAFASQMVGNLIEADAYCRLFCADEEELGEAKSKLACANKFEDLSKLQKEIRKIN